MDGRKESDLGGNSSQEKMLWEAEANIESQADCEAGLGPTLFLQFTFFFCKNLGKLITVVSGYSDRGRCIQCCNSDQVQCYSLSLLPATPSLRRTMEGVEVLAYR